MAPTMSEQRFISSEVTAALRRHGLAFDSPVSELLAAGATVAGDHEFSVRARANGGNSVTLDDRIEELKADPRYANLFPNLPRVPHNDMSKLKAAFADIAAGKVQVE